MASNQARMKQEHYAVRAHGAYNPHTISKNQETFFPLLELPNERLLQIASELLREKTTLSKRGLRGSETNPIDLDDDEDARDDFAQFEDCECCFGLVDTPRGHLSFLSQFRLVNRRCSSIGLATLEMRWNNDLPFPLRDNIVLKPLEQESRHELFCAATQSSLSKFCRRLDIHIDEEIFTYPETETVQVHKVSKQPLPIALPRQFPVDMSVNGIANLHNLKEIHLHLSMCRGRACLEGTVDHNGKTAHGYLMPPQSEDFRLFKRGLAERSRWLEMISAVFKNLKCITQKDAGQPPKMWIYFSAVLEPPVELLHSLRDAIGDTIELSVVEKAHRIDGSLPLYMQDYLTIEMHRSWVQRWDLEIMAAAKVGYLTLRKAIADNHKQYTTIQRLGETLFNGHCRQPFALFPSLTRLSLINLTVDAAAFENVMQTLGPRLSSLTTAHLAIRNEHYHFRSDGTPRSLRWSEPFNIINGIYAFLQYCTDLQKLRLEVCKGYFDWSSSSINDMLFAIDRGYATSVSDVRCSCSMPECRRPDCLDLGPFYLDNVAKGC